MFLGIIFLVISFSQYSCNDEIVTPPVDPNNNEITVYDEEPCWSPDGNSIAYLGGNSADGFKIIAVDTNSLNKRILIQSPGFSLQWSPDGQWILYEWGGIIYKKRISDESLPIQLTFLGGCFNPSWSRDGEWIAFDTNNESPDGSNFVWKMRSDGTSKKRIIFSPSLGEVRAPSWFPDGIRLAVSRYNPSHGFDSEIAIIDTSGNSIAMLTNDSEDDYDPEVSPDGQYILWWKYANGRMIFTMKSDGTLQTQIATHATRPDWSPNSKMITYTNTNYNDGRIWIMNKDGSSRKKISY